MNVKKKRQRKTIVGLGNRILNARVALGYDNRREFALKINIAYATLTDYETEATVPAADKLIVLCKELGVSADWLLFGVKGNKKYLKNNELFSLFKKVENLSPKDVDLLKKLINRVFINNENAV